MTDGRREVEELTGSTTVPVLVTDSGEAIGDSKAIVAWAEAHPASAGYRLAPLGLTIAWRRSPPSRPGPMAGVCLPGTVCANQHEIMSRSLQFDVELCTLPQLDNR